MFLTSVNGHRGGVISPCLLPQTGKHKISVNEPKRGTIGCSAKEKHLLLAQLNVRGNHNLQYAMKSHYHLIRHSDL